MNNVTIKLKRAGVLVHEYSGHNVWTEDGHAYLANLVALSAYATDVPFVNSRIKYMGFGIGGTGQTYAAADGSPFTTYYPAGSDPSATNGHKYNPKFPIDPLITSLERPIIITSSDGISAYPGTAGDHYITPVAVFFSTAQMVEFTVSFTVNSSTFLLSTFTEIPLSEIGLFLSTATTSNAFNAGKLMAYHSFDTLLVSDGMELEFSWKVVV